MALGRRFSIGTLTQQFGVSAESIRNWEKQGLIPHATRTPGGHRRYTQVHIDAIESIFDTHKLTSKVLGHE